MSKHFWAWFRVRQFLWDERDQDQSVIRDHSHHARSNEPMNPCPEWIHRFIWSTMIWVISDHWSWSGSSQRNAPLHKRHDSLYIISFTIQLQYNYAQFHSSDLDLRLANFKICLKMLSEWSRFVWSHCKRKKGKGTSCWIYFFFISVIERQRLLLIVYLS